MALLPVRPLLPARGPAAVFSSSSGKACASCPTLSLAAWRWEMFSLRRAVGFSPQAGMKLLVSLLWSLLFDFNDIKDVRTPKLRKSSSVFHVLWRVSSAFIFVRAAGWLAGLP